MKKALAIVLALLLTVCVLPTGIVASAENTSGITGDCTWTLKDGILTISGNGKMGYYAHWDFYSPWYGDTSITNVIIEDGVTNIGSAAFYGCAGLTSIYIPDSVTSIGSSAFWACKGLTSITIPNSVTSIEESAFGHCTALEIINIHNGLEHLGNSAFYNTAYYNDSKNWIDGVLYIGNYLVEINNNFNLETYTVRDGTIGIINFAFSDYKNLTSITLPNSVKWIDGAFRGCTGLTSITIPDNVTTIGESAFYNCTGLTSITIPNSVTTINSYAFYNCVKLENIIIPDNVTRIDNYAFTYTAYYNNSNNWKNDVLYIGKHLIQAMRSISTSYSIPTGILTISESAFEYCDSLTSITIPNSVTCIGNEAFSGCTGLTSITIPNSVTSIGEGAFSYCAGLASITVDESNTVYHSENNCLIEKETKELISGCKNSVIPSDGSVTSIGDSAFSNCTGLTSITIPNSVTSIGDSAFTYCTELTSITIPNSVTSIGHYAFNGCTGLTDVYYSGSEEERNNISIGEWEIDYLFNATWHYNYVPTPEIKYGLVTENEEISATDALAILHAVVGKVEFTDAQKTAGDVNGDGEITATDALLILQFIVGKIDKFPVEQ